MLKCEYLIPSYYYAASHTLLNQRVSQAFTNLIGFDFVIAKENICVPFSAMTTLTNSMRRIRFQEWDRVDPDHRLQWLI